MRERRLKHNVLCEFRSKVLEVVGISRKREGDPAPKHQKKN